MPLVNHATLGEFTLPVHMQARLNPCAWFMSFQKSFLNFDKVKTLFLVLMSQQTKLFCLFSNTAAYCGKFASPTPSIFFLQLLDGNKTQQIKSFVAKGYNLLHSNLLL